MGVIIEDIRITNEFRSETTNYLVGNIGDKITIEVDYRVEEVFITENLEDIDRILLAPQSFRVNEVNTKDIIFCEQPSAFANIFDGDFIDYNNATTSIGFEIYEKINDETLRVKTQGGTIGDVDFFASNGNSFDTETPTNGFVALTTDFKGVRYKYGFVGNDNFASYESRIDQETQLLKADGVDDTDITTQVPMLFKAPKTYQIGSATVRGNGSTSTAQKFTITHTTFITPVHIAEELQNLKNNIKPPYLESNNSIKYVLSIEAGRNLSDPNFLQLIDFDELEGNVGWFDENFNGGENFYTNLTPIFTRQPSTEVIDSIELVTTDQNIEITIKNTRPITNPFVNGLTIFKFHHQIVPESVLEYTNNNKTIIENFFFDKATNVIGAVAVNGDNFGTDQQIIKGLSSTFISSSEFKLTVTLALSAVAVADLVARSDIEYLLWISIGDHNLTTELSDRVSLKIAPKTYFQDFTDDSLFAITSLFLDHTESDVTTEGSSTLLLRPQDDVLVYNTITIDRLGRETDEILITEIIPSLVMKKTGAEFTLEDFVQSFSGTQVIGDTQFIDVTTDRVFQMPDNEQRKQIKIKRRSDLDTTDLRFYEVFYPFMVRWEDWQQLLNVNGDMFDISEDNNGQNHDWQRYDTISGWDLYYRLTVKGTKNGNPIIKVKDTLFTTLDYTEDSDWINETIKAFDVATNTELVNGIDKLLKTETRIEITKEFSGGSPPSLAQVEWLMMIETFREGGIEDIRFLSSVYNWTQFSWFTSTDSSNKVVKSLNSGVFKAEALINFSELPDNIDFTVSGRIYDKTTVVAVTFCILQEGGGKILQEGGGCIEHEH